MYPTSAVTRLQSGMLVSEMDLVMNRMGYIAHRVLPIITRDKPSGQYPLLTKEQLLQIRSTQRAPGGGYPRSSTGFSLSTYSTAEQGHEAPLDDRTVAAYDDVLDAEMWESERIRNIVLQNYEIEIADYLFNATTFSGKTAGVSTEWSTVASATPVSDVETRRETIYNATGYEPNALVINRQVFRNLRRSAQVIDTLKYQGFQDARPGEISAQALAISLDLDMIIVANGTKNTANEADAASLSRIWSSEYALLCRVATTSNPSEFCLGRTIVWDAEAALDGERMGVIMESYRDETVRGDVLRARTDWEKKIIDLDAAYLLSNITA